MLKNSLRNIKISQAMLRCGTVQELVEALLHKVAYMRANFLTSGCIFISEYIPDTARYQAAQTHTCETIAFIYVRI